MSRVNNRKKKTNYANNFAIILLIAVAANLTFFWLPDSIFGIPVKKVDLLSDIRVSVNDDRNRSATFEAKNEAIDINTDTSDSNLEQQPLASDNFQPEQSDEDPDALSTDEDSNNSRPILSDFDRNNTDYLSNKNIEDFTSEHTGLRRFFAALNNIDNLGRPVRIAFVGDSFIEGDIIVADFRAKMQEHFGGRGVGFLPMASIVEQYRPTIKQSSKGWNTYSIIKNRNKKFIISGLLFEPTSDNASVNFETVNMYPSLEEVSSIKLIYSKNEKTDLILKYGDETAQHELPPTDNITQYEIKGSFTKGSLQFKNADGFNSLGLAFEDNNGIIVDNFSLRGNSGIIMSELDSESCRRFQHIRPYDLIVLQYGLNVASDSVRDYSWYRNRMIPVVEHIQNCFPETDILILGVSDRSHKKGSEYTTMPAVLSLLHSQRQIAIETEVTFWSIFAGMGGQNSMINYVNSNWASKDYTHLSFRGGREVANALFDAIITEKSFYDNEEQYIEQ